MKFNHLLKLLDRYPFKAEVKGGSRWLDSKNIIITTNKHPKDTYNLPEEDIKQLLRRIDLIERFSLNPVQDKVMSQDQELGNINKLLSSTIC